MTLYSTAIYRRLDFGINIPDESIEGPGECVPQKEVAESGTTHKRKISEVLSSEEYSNSVSFGGKAVRRSVRPAVKALKGLLEKTQKKAKELPQERYLRELRTSKEVQILKKLEEEVYQLDASLHYEIEAISGHHQTAALSVYPRKEKTFSEKLGTLRCYLHGYSHSTIKRERRALALRHICARKCKLWHKPKKLDLADEMCDRCSECRLARRQMLIVRDRRTSLLEEERIERQQASSKVRLSFSSPETQKVRHENVRKERKNFIRIAERIVSRTSVTVNQQQNSELVKLVQSIESCNEGQEGLAKEVEEADNHKPCTGAVIREMWQMEKESYFKDQAKNDSWWDYLISDESTHARLQRMHYDVDGNVVDDVGMRLVYVADGQWRYYDRVSQVERHASASRSVHFNRRKVLSHSPVRSKLRKFPFKRDVVRHPKLASCGLQHLPNEILWRILTSTFLLHGTHRATWECIVDMWKRNHTLEHCAVQNKTEVIPDVEHDKVNCCSVRSISCQITVLRSVCKLWRDLMDGYNWPHAYIFNVYRKGLYARDQSVDCSIVMRADMAKFQRQCRLSCLLVDEESWDELDRQMILEILHTDDRRRLEGLCITRVLVHARKFVLFKESRQSSSQDFRVNAYNVINTLDDSENRASVSQLVEWQDMEDGSERPQNLNEHLKLFKSTYTLSPTSMSKECVFDTRKISDATERAFMHVHDTQHADDVPEFLLRRFFVTKCCEVPCTNLTCKTPRRSFANNNSTN
ncbi:hypothetical protein AWC38_SpisGene23076 [Stylophora pistillata]|uniref:Uncharacterized protein n=1 Tax=Stylophora pistillata TaxID=50429 RepID=A0A2B4R7U0_STYPI|nr:hypothetical protein AWC38_SpisGene23076 [Stylophora pistillata]